MSRAKRKAAILKAGQDWLFHDDHDRFVREVLAAARTEAPKAEPVAPEGYVIVPLHPNRDMERVMETDEWQWSDLLAAAGTVTEEDCYATPPSADSVRREALKEAAALCDRVKMGYGPGAVFDAHTLTARDIRALAAQPASPESAEPQYESVTSLSPQIMRPQHFDASVTSIVSATPASPCRAGSVASGRTHGGAWRSICPCRASARGSSEDRRDAGGGVHRRAGVTGAGV